MRKKSPPSEMAKRAEFLLFFVVIVPTLTCNSELECSLNGECGADRVCRCDPGWVGTDCGTLSFAPSPNATTGPEMARQPLCCYHGDDNNTYSWGASVQRAPEDGNHYMWVAVMTNHCTISQWRTNSEVQLARSSNGPLGPFVKLADVVLPWAHNPQTIISPDPSTEHGYVYALYTLGDGTPESGEPVNCTHSYAKQAVAAQARLRAPSRDFINATTGADTPASSTITANFTIHWAERAAGPYRAYRAAILNWPANWDYGAHGNWNPSPFQHPNGTVYLMAHTSWRAFCGEAILAADTWRGPYRVVASDTYSTWGGNACGVEDPFMYVDKRGHWHVLYHSMHFGPGGHAYSVDGLSWSNVTAAYNTSRPLVGGGSVNYNAERPKLLFGPAPDLAPTHLYTGSSKAQGFTIVSPLTA